MEVESMKKLKSTIEKCIVELAEKSDLSPAETKTLKDGLEAMDMLDCKIEDCKMKNDMEYSERGYSGHDTPFREYRITSYGRPMRMSHGDSYRPMHISYGDRPMNGYSGDYGVQGWYRSDNGMSRNGYDPYYDNMYMDRGRNGGYSRHSIGDRVIEMLEHKMDETQSDYEREELRKYMHLIRQAAD